MATYAIGDVQGCYDTLQKLLETIHFDPEKDSLWFTGDLVNRGPDSLKTLRFIKQLGKKAIVVLGNHDLHLLAVLHGVHPGWEEDTLTDILHADDRHELTSWLQQQPLLHHEQGYTMVHAGLAPMWDLDTAKKLAHEVETVLKSEQATDFLKQMYGNEPSQWDEKLRGIDRLRCITNYFTRARFCRLDGSLELTAKGKLNSMPTDLIPWFQHPHRVNANLKIIFGHWAALSGVTNTANVFALDTGCVWGFYLTAMRLGDEKRWAEKCVAGSSE